MKRGILAAIAATVLAGVWSPAWAQPQALPSRFGIADNSFLVEEAFNQERGVFQNIFTFIRSTNGDFESAFTQEWPFRTQRHQLSYTISASSIDGRGTLGDVLINYRFQAAMEEGHPAFSPRLSVILPASAERRELGARGVGWQINLPFSKQAGWSYFHWNLGSTWLRPEAGGDEAWRRSTFAAGSIIVSLRPMLHLMCESALDFDNDASGRTRTITVAPGVRGGWNSGDKQTVVGGSVLLTRGDNHDTAVLLYFSYELPFLRSR